ncbi:HD domain-containing protein [Uliginosibacterium aquaticum]|uniref:HD domain-containing protein n=1 Tax=Uliginosibacterium aquaticum TaxID=2731212 RepID=A0ABX2IH63_9RHOO|nr:HD domain-containing protein [Uliginosibacterium aquaticum]NSL56149.1 HD domain-containing protein [Uliginosibacterium aquaticum]
MSTDALLDFVLTLDRLKAVERRTSPAGLERRENSAEHSWHGALCALLLERECAFPVDAKHAALLFLMHDVPEIECGDTFAYAAARADAAAAEALGLESLLATLPAQTGECLRALWQEFTAGETPEARYANALDRVMPLLHNISHGGKVWHEHGVTLAQVLARNAFVAEVLPAVWQRLLPRIERLFSGVADE